MLPKELVKTAVEATGQGLTPTIRLGLRKIAMAHACERLRMRRGKVKFSINVDELRED